ncbi:hypothetical protein E4U43_001242 [Claviceps pusilla]|uniref:BHLH domain-containing protein n=1 Tax=Claviceps pusilla TaxID=123648 RepID=A0A9P7SZG1_9HYPO|nr:hypothetical protein E4U43_001242 [Claviceps pusilla]
MASATWSGQDQHMTSSTTEEEFNQFLDMSGMTSIGETMQFDFHGFQNGPSQALLAQHRQQQQQQQRQHRQQADSLMSEADPPHIPPSSDDLLQNHTPAIATTLGMSGQMLATPAPGDTISSIDAQILYLQQQKFHQQQRQLQEQRITFFSHHHSVPPTPRSLELSPGTTGHFYSPAEQIPQRASYDRGYHHPMSEQHDMALTPLISPAVTPLDPHFYMENAFTIPAAYFSPLTSPALHAQNDASSLYDHSTQSHNSPVEMDLEAPVVAPSVGSSTDLSKKARKNNAAVKARGKPAIKSSPIVKPQRRKTGPSPAIVSQVLSELDESNSHFSTQGFLPMPATSPTEVSEENASVSPENLTDMPPPPVPSRRSTSRSPYIQAQNYSSQQPTPRSLSEEQNQRQQQQQQLPHPATPASLMKLPASKAKTKQSLAMNQEHNTVTDNIESLELPESIANPPPLAPIDTSTALTSPRIEPTLSRSTSQQPLQSPVIRNLGTTSASQSPQLRAGSSDPSARRTPLLASRSSRKRSTGSVHASPALLPRISPNIKPLLPGGPRMSMEDAASRLLMTKSNYQNILEGNTVPGVSYPTELSTNLTSKRTSHKIAEQGRRNRINSALQVMASLLPDQSNLKECEEAEKKENKGQGNIPNSKASVVESAIVHMKYLQQENVDLKAELEQLKSQLEKIQEPSAS